MPNDKPMVSDDKREEATAPPTNRARAGTIPMRFKRPPRPSTLSSADDEEYDEDAMTVFAI
jgi:hypothetical protein